MYQEKGEYDKALSMFEHVLAMRRKAFGDEHPSVAATLNNMGAVSVLVWPPCECVSDGCGCCCCCACAHGPGVRKEGRVRQGPQHVRTGLGHVESVSG